MSSISELSARLDPNYSLQTFKLRESIYANYQIAAQNNNAAMNREHVRGDYELNKQRMRDNSAFEREQFKSNREDSRLEKTIGAQYGVERMRGENNTNLSRVEHGHKAELANIEHANAITRMETDLTHHITKSGLSFIDNSIFRLMDEDSARWKSSRDQMEKNSALMGDVFKMFAGAVFQELAEQNRHDRDLEKMDKESALRRADAYWSSLCSYLIALLDKGKEREAKSEIDRLVSQWEAS
jgi:hypothetical protein